MTMTDDPVLDALIRANPHPRESIPGPERDAQARALLASITATPAPPRRSRPPRVVGPALVAGVSILVVLAVAAIALHAGAARHRSATTTVGASSQVELKLQAPPGSSVTSAAVGREVSVLRARLRNAAGLRGERFIRVNSDVLAIRSAALAASRPMQRLLTDDPHIAVIDWEGELISPDGQTVASQLLNGQYPPAQTLSQGSGTGVNTLPGGRGAGAQTLYSAVRLASRQPTLGFADRTRQGPESFAFAPAGSPRCQSAVPCWAAGPSTTRAAAIRQAQRARVSHPIVLTVPQGTSVVQSTGTRADIGADYRQRTARFFVVRDAAALTTAEFRDASTTSQHGEIAVKTNLTPAGARAFARVTDVIAHRGQSLRLGTQSNYQHFAILDNDAILEVGIINYVQYPDGVQPPLSQHGFEIEGISHATAERITQQIKLGALPLKTQILRDPSQ
jgi:hypothetical protein